MEQRQGTLSRRHLAAGLLGLVGATAVGAEQGAAQDVAAEPVIIIPPPISDPSTYTAYIPAVCKTGPFFHYTCEFDASWAVLKTYGIDATLDEQIARIDIDDRIEPNYQETSSGFTITGGDIRTRYSGDYKTNFLARTTGGGMQQVFHRFGLTAIKADNRARIERHLRAGRLIWIKMTVDFKDWVPATWITPEGAKVQGVLGNDHAAIVMGYNHDVVVIRDVLGPTSSNWDRLYEYEVPWDRFLECWSAQQFDGLAVGPR